MKVTVYLWETEQAIAQMYSRKVDYKKGEEDKFRPALNAIREEIFPGNKKPLACRHVPFPDQDITCVYVDTETGEEYKVREVKNMHRIQNRRQRDQRTPRAPRPAPKRPQGLGTMKDAMKQALEGVEATG